VDEFLANLPEEMSNGRTSESSESDDFEAADENMSFEAMKAELDAMELRFRRQRSNQRPIPKTPEASTQTNPRAAIKSKFPIQISSKMPLRLTRSYCKMCAQSGVVDNCFEVYWKPDAVTGNLVTYTVYPAETTTTYSHIGCTPKTAHDEFHSCDYSSRMPYNYDGFPNQLFSTFEHHKLQMKRLILLSQGKDDSEMPDEIRARPQMLKYWYRRYDIFRKYDKGIKLDLGKKHYGNICKV